MSTLKFEAWECEGKLQITADVNFAELQLLIDILKLYVPILEAGRDRKEPGE